MEGTRSRGAKGGAMTIVYIILAIVFVALLWGLMRVRGGRRV
jgi:hypothetical protein